MRRALIVEHDHLDPAGALGDAIEARGYQLDILQVVPEDRYHNPGVTVAFPDPARYDLVAAMGAPWSVHDPAIYRWAGAEADMLRAAVQAGVPVLAVCFGAQLLAAAHGGTVTPATRPGYGWHRVSTIRDWHLVPPGPWFSWHSDRLTPPPGARILAETPGVVQAYTIWRCLGVQFHPEADLDLVASWIGHDDRGELAAAGADPDVILRDTAAFGPSARRACDTLAGRFLHQAAVPAR